MKVRIKEENGYVDADWTIEDGVMVVSPKEVKFVPKDGDVVNADNCICIFKKERGSVITSFESYIILDNQQLRIGINVFYAKFRPATEEEKKKLFDKLAEEGWEWKADTKELVKIKWKPKAKEHYFKPMFELGQFITKPTRWSNDDVDITYYEKGWIFKEQIDCENFCLKLNDAIRQVKP